VTPELEVVSGWCASEIEQELPGLRLLTADVRVGRRESLTGATPADVERHLKQLSNRFRGATAVAARREPVPSAYRVFYRQIGLDPEVVRTPLEAALLERMIKGGFLPRGLLADVLLVGLLDTGVPIWALDASAVEGPLGIRTSEEGESFGRDANAAALPGGQLVVADATTPLAVLFGRLAKAHRPTARSERLMLFAVQVAGVPQLYAEEALWTCCSALDGTGHW
jgi:DNA/RNA-binding domain of Phe-tRNA-synthetase-like protein